MVLYGEEMQVGTKPVQTVFKDTQADKADRLTGSRQVDGQMDGQTDRWANRQAYRQIGGWTDG